MEKPEYEQWWQLHLRVAQGEILFGTERTSYQNGLLKLQSAEGEVGQDLIVQLQQLRRQLDEMSVENVVLQQKHEQLDQEIAALEVAYQTLTGQPINADPYATQV